MTVDFAITCSLVRPGRPHYPVLVHRAAALLHASFRHRLAAAPLRFANPSPPSGRIEDFHLQAVVHARHTRKAPLNGGMLSGTLGHIAHSARANQSQQRLGSHVPKKSPAGKGKDPVLEVAEARYAHLVRSRPWASCHVKFLAERRRNAMRRACAPPRPSGTGARRARDVSSYRVE